MANSTLQAAKTAQSNCGKPPPSPTVCGSRRARTGRMSDTTRLHNPPKDAINPAMTAMPCAHTVKRGRRMTICPKTLLVKSTRNRQGRESQRHCLRLRYEISGDQSLDGEKQVLFQGHAGKMSNCIDCIQEVQRIN